MEGRWRQMGSHSLDEGATRGYWAGSDQQSGNSCRRDTDAGHGVRSDGRKGGWLRRWLCVCVRWITGDKC